MKKIKDVFKNIFEEEDRKKIPYIHYSIILQNNKTIKKTAILTKYDDITLDNIFRDIISQNKINEEGEIPVQQNIQQQPQQPIQQQENNFSLESAVPSFNLLKQKFPMKKIFVTISDEKQPPALRSDIKEGGVGFILSRNQNNDIEISTIENGRPGVPEVLNNQNQIMKIQNNIYNYVNTVVLRRE